MIKKVISVFLSCALILGIILPLDTVKAEQLDNNAITSTNGDSFTLTNDILKVIVNKGGNFQIYTTGGDPENKEDDNKRMVYGNTNAEAIKVGNQIKYISSKRESTYWQNTNIVNNEIISTSSFGNVSIKRTIRLTNAPTSNLADAVKFEYAITNNSTSSQDVSFQLMLDTFVGKTDQSPFNIPGVGKTDTGKKLTGGQVPNYWFAYDNLEEPSAVTKGTFPVDSKPSVIDFSNWNSYSSNVWNQSVTNSKNGDSCVTMYWNNNILNPNQTKVITNYYSVSSLNTNKNSNLAVSLLNGKTVTINPNNDNTYTPYETTATIQNVGNIALDNIEMTIVIPEQFKNILSLDGSTAYKLGGLKSGAEIQKDLKFNILNSGISTVQNIYYEIIVKSNSTSPITIRQNLILNNSTYTPSKLLDFNVAGPRITNYNLTLSANATPVNDTLYKFFVYDYATDKWSDLTTFTANKSTVWKPTKAGKYRFVVHVKSKYSTKTTEDDYLYEDVDIKDYVPSKVTGFKKYGDAVVNSSVKLGAMGTPADQTLFKFWVYDYATDKWSVLQDYSSNPNAYWTPTKKGKYRLVLHVKNMYSQKTTEDDYDFFDIDV